MARKTETISIAEATATLPEGATVSVSKIGGKHPFVEIRAWREDAIVKMRGDDVAPHNLQAYLDLMVRAINRERAKHLAKPLGPATRPYDIRTFVLHMCHHDMFLFEALTPEAAVDALSLELKKSDDNYNEETGHCATPKKKRKAKREKKTNDPF